MVLRVRVGIHIEVHSLILIPHLLELTSFDSPKARLGAWEEIQTFASTGNRNRERGRLLYYGDFNLTIINLISVRCNICNFGTRLL